MDLSGPYVWQIFICRSALRGTKYLYGIPFGPA